MDLYTSRHYSQYWFTVTVVDGVTFQVVTIILLVHRVNKPVCVSLIIYNTAA
jgi:hypothetical protein